MGWCSGTMIFDNLSRYILELDDVDLSENHKIEMLSILISSLWDQDWDCESDSGFWDDPIVKKAVLRLDPNWEF